MTLLVPSTCETHPNDNRRNANDHEAPSMGRAIDLTGLLTALCSTAARAQESQSAVSAPDALSIDPDASASIVSDDVRAAPSAPETARQSRSFLDPG